MKRQQKYANLQEMMESLGATKSQIKLLNFIVESKDSTGDLVPGMIQVPIRAIKDRLNLAMGTVTRGLEFWEQRGVIRIEPGENRRVPNIVKYLGTPMTSEHDVLAFIEEELGTIKEALNLIEARLNPLLRKRGDCANQTMYRLSN